jgi:hypothetical protein
MVVASLLNDGPRGTDAVERIRWSQRCRGVLMEVRVVKTFLSARYHPFLVGLLLASFLVTGSPVAVAAFTCGGKIVSEGDSIDLVVARCGEPSGRHVVREEFSGGTSGTTQYVGRGRYVHHGSFGGSVEVVESVTYNCGDNRLIHRLRFRAGTLYKVETIGHGNGPRRCD